MDIGHLYVFCLYSKKPARQWLFYIGQTENLDARLSKHNSGLIISTKSRKPLILVRKEIFETRSAVRKRENYLKKLKGGNEFEKIIRLI